MKMARELGTMTYRSGPEWNERFARKRIDPDVDPALCPTFLIESYLDYQGTAPINFIKMLSTYSYASMCVRVSVCITISNSAQRTV